MNRFTSRHSLLRYALCLLLCLTLSLPLTGCMSVEQTNESLTVWVADPDVARKHFSNALAKFKSAHPDMAVQFAEAPDPVDFYTGGEDYAEYKDVTLPQYADQMRTEVMGHRGPDLIIFDEDTFPNLYKTVASGAFAPLDELIQGDETWTYNDPSQPEYFSQDIMEVGKYKGKQYFIPLTYDMPIIISAKNTVVKYGLSPDELTRHDQVLAMMRAAAENNGAPRLFGARIDDNINYILWDGVLDMDFYEKTVSLDRERFAELEESYLTIYQYDKKSHPRIDTYPALSSGELLCTVNADTSLALDVVGCYNYYAEPYISPLLNANGEISAYLDMGAAINAYSKNQQNAYEFLKCAMESSTYNPIYSDYCGLPFNRASMEKWIARHKERNRTVGPEEAPFPSKAMPDSYFEDILSWHESIGTVYVNTGLDEQVREWFTPYYEGKQSFDSCYGVMENTLNIIISE